VRLIAGIGIICGVSALAALAYFVTRPQTAEGVVQKFHDYMAKKTPISCDYTLQWQKTEMGKGRYSIERGKRQRMDLKWLNFDYSYAQDAKGVLEIERSEKMYAEMGPLFDLYEPKSFLSEAPAIGFPTILLAGDLKQFVGGPYKLKLVGPEKVGGEDTQHVHVESLGARFETTMEANVANDGRLLRFSIHVVADTGIIDTKFEFSNYRTSGIGDSAFALSVPVGYSPDTVPRVSDCIQPGETVPNLGGKLYGLTDGPMLVALVGPSCESSLRSVPMLKKVNETVPVVLIPDRPVVAIPPPYIGFQNIWRYDSQVDKLRASGTPLFVLMGSDRKVSRVWFGYDDETRDALGTEIAEAARKLK